jgi:hypothetical protein
MTDPTRWSVAEIQAWRSRLADDLEAQGIEDDGLAQRWLLKAIAAQVWMSSHPAGRPRSWSAIHDNIQQIHERSGLIPNSWRSDSPEPSDRICDGLAALPPHSSHLIPLLADVYGQAPTGQRPKTGGIYYTPWLLIERMVQHTVGQRAIAAPMRIIDPACGGGAFLLMVGRSLAARQSHGMSFGGSVGTKAMQVLGQLHGVDVDAEAVAIARLMLWLEWANPAEPTDAIALAQTLMSTLRVGNAVLEPDWSQWFPEAHRGGGFDIVIGNPPYLDSETMTRHYPQWRRYCASRYATATGNWDVFCVFVEQALSLARDGGWVSLVVPNKLLSANYASPVRSLLGQHQLQWIWDYAQADAFPTAAVYPVVFLVEKRPSDCACDQGALQLVPYQVMRSLMPNTCDDPPHETHQLWTGSSGADWRVVKSPIQAEVWQRIEQQTQPLGAIATVCGAATVSEAYVLADYLQDGADGGEALDGMAVINSGIIDRYRVRWGEKPLRYLGQVYQRPYLSSDRLSLLSQSRYRQTLSPKLIVAGLTRRLEVAIDVQGRLLAAKSTSIILPNGQPNQLSDPSGITQVPTTEALLFYLLGILNSQLMNHYVQMRFMGNRLSGGYMRIGPPQLRQLPIMPWSDRAVSIVEQAQRLLHHTAKPESCPVILQSYEQQLDALVYQHYELDADNVALLAMVN